MTVIRKDRESLPGVGRFESSVALILKDIDREHPDVKPWARLLGQRATIFQLPD